MKVRGRPEPIFREKIAQDPQRSVLPLQASDLLAYEIVKNYRDIDTRPLRHPLKELERTRADWGIYDERNIEGWVSVAEAATNLEAIVKGQSSSEGR